MTNLTTGVDTTDPTLICKVRIPLTSMALITLAAVVMDHPDHSVHVEGEWLTVRALLAGRSDASPEGGEHQAPAAQAADERARIVWWLRASASGPAGVNHSEDYVRAVWEMAAAIEQHPERFADAPTKETP